MKNCVSDQSFSSSCDSSMEVGDIDYPDIQSLNGMQVEIGPKKYALIKYISQGSYCNTYLALVLGEGCRPVCLKMYYVEDLKYFQNEFLAMGKLRGECKAAAAADFYATEGASSSALLFFSEN